MPVCPYCKRETRFSQRSPSMFRCTECHTEYLDYYFFSLPRDSAIQTDEQILSPQGADMPIPRPEPDSRPAPDSEQKAILREILSEPSKAETADKTPIKADCLEDFPSPDSRKPFLASGYSILAWYDRQFASEDYSCFCLIASILHLDLKTLRDIVRPLGINENRCEASLRVPKYLPTVSLASDMFQYFLTPEDIRGLPVKCHRYSSMAQGYPLLNVLRYIEKDIGLAEYHAVKYCRTKSKSVKLKLAD